MSSRRAPAAVFLIGVALSAAVPASADQVINDDLIVDGSACIGGQCVENLNFGNDTLWLKDFAVRIFLEDTSQGASLTENDWRIVINDNAFGGLDHFSIDDVTGDNTPFRIEAGASDFALYVAARQAGDEGARVGIGTTMPDENLHIVDGRSPKLRLEQDGSDGFFPRVWDILANDLYFAIEDVTGGGVRPLRVEAGTPSDSLFVESTGNVGLGTDEPVARLDVRGDAVVDGDFSAGSSRHLKHRFEAVESRAVLERLLELPVTEWSYRTDAPGVRHMGPVSEDFSAAFGLGRDDRHVSPVDLSGVAFVAIQGLHEIVRERDAEIEAIRQSRDELTARLAAVERRLAVARSLVCPWQ